jgi:signal transduction histidine kinase
MKIKPSNKIIIIFTITVIIIGIIFFPILPRLLNYPPDSINNEFQRNIDLGILYTEQYILIIFLCFLIGLIAIKLSTKILDINEDKDFSKYNKDNTKIIGKIFNLPYKIYLIHLLIPSIAIISLYAISEGSINIGTLKIALLIVTIETLIALVVFIYCKNLISKILERNNINEKYINKFSSLKTKIFIIILPMILVALVFTSLLGYSRIVEEKSQYMYLSNEMILEENFTKKDYTLNEVETILENIKLLQDDDTQFIIYEDGDYTTLNKKNLSDFFIKYTLQKSENQRNRTYETYGIDIQGAVKQINIDGSKAYIGIAFNIVTDSTLIYFLVGIVILFLINCIVLYYIAKSLADDTRKVSEALNNIVKNKNKKQKKHLPITSNDEIAQLVIAFNKIQDITDNYIEEIENNQYVMQRQAQFSILGEFAGGIAHDLNSPLSAMQLDIGMLKDDILPSKIQAEPEIKEILQDVLNNIDKSIEKMSKTIAGVRNQIRSTADTEKERFSFVELIEGIEILFGSLLRKNNCQLIYDKSKDYYLYGEKNKLDRVIGNVIKNSIDAYIEKEKKGKIEVSISKNDKEYIIKIADEAGGIPNEIKDTLFKEMRTTKGENGTGFGLYYSNTIIESSFKGTITFETKENVGTTFYINLPLKYNNKEEN